MIKILSDTEPGTLAVSISGKLAHDDHATLESELQLRADRVGDFNLVVELSDIHGLEVSAIRDDLMFAKKCAGDIDKWRWSQPMSPGVHSRRSSASLSPAFSASRSGDSTTASAHGNGFATNPRRFTDLGLGLHEVIKNGHHDIRRAVGQVPDALEHGDEFRQRLAGRRPAVFLDFDGTLAPIVSRPQHAELRHAWYQHLRPAVDVLNTARNRQPKAQVRTTGPAKSVARAARSVARNHAVWRQSTRREIEALPIGSTILRTHS